jgi:hypothetical protein
MNEQCPSSGFTFGTGTCCVRESSALQRADVLSLPALGALGDVEFDALALLEALETASLDRREVHENVFASLPADEAVALSVIEPLYCSLFCHLDRVSFSIELRWKEFGSTLGRR